MTNILEVIKQMESVHFACMQRINWNVQMISGSENSNGFILQHLSKRMEPADAIDLKELEDITYFEAWEVKDGRITEEDKGKICNDEFLVGNMDFPFLHFPKCLGTKGSIRFCGEVYWIPFESDLYRIICSWSKDTVEQAAGLRATYENIAIDPSYRHFTREPFEHKWDLSGEEKILEAARKLLFEDCRTDDYDVFKARLESMFNRNFSTIVEEIRSEWKSKHDPGLK